jgi:hypothetical protein
MVIRASKYLQPGRVALEREGKIVWVGRLGDPIEDAVCDVMIVSEVDYQRIKRQIRAK